MVIIITTIIITIVPKLKAVLSIVTKVSILDIYGDPGYPNVLSLSVVYNQPLSACFYKWIPSGSWHQV